MIRFLHVLLPATVFILTVAGLMGGAIGHIIVLKDARARSRQEFVKALLVPFYVAYFAVAKFSHRQKPLVLRVFFGGYALALAGFYIGAIAT